MDDAVQQFIDQLRSLLQSPEAVLSEELISAIAQYSAYCEEANRRLRDCFRLIQKGQYANAVELAEREPNLLDRCSLLEIPERETLAAAAQSLGARSPTLIVRELVELLQDACQKGNSAAGNLRLLHRLTLARAPLPARLAVMRRLAIQNPNHPHLDADIRTFERAWFKQALSVAQRFASEGNLAAIEEIVGDLRSSGYLETPPSHLFAALQTQQSKVRATQLPALADAIRKAHREQSVEDAKICFKQWESVAADHPEARAAFGLDDAFEWFEQACAADKLASDRQKAQSALSRLIHLQGVARPQLDEAYSKAASLGAVEPGLEANYRSKNASLTRRRVFKIVTACLSCLVLVLAVGAGAIVATRRAGQDRKVEALVASLTRLIDHGDVDVAVTDAQDAGDLVNDPRIATLLEAATAEQSRRTSLRAAIAQIEQCPPDGDPKSSISGARAEAKTDEDKSAIEQAESRWTQRKSEWEASQADRFQRDFNALAGEAVALASKARQGTGSLSEVADVRSRLQAMREKVRQSGIGDNRLHEIEKNLDTAERWQSFAERSQTFAASIKDHPVSADTLDRLAKYLTNTIALTCPDPAIARRAKQANASLEAWKKALSLETRLSQADSGESQPLSEAMVLDWKDTAPGHLVMTKCRCQEMLRQRDPAISGTASAELRGYIARREIARLWMTRQVGESGMRYYSETQPARKGKHWRVKALLDAEGTSEELDLPASDWKVVEAPQSVFAREVGALWNGKGSSWNESLAAVYGRVRKLDAMEPLLRLLLVRKLLKLAASTSEGFRTQLESLSSYKTLTGDEILSSMEGNWLNPKTDLDSKRNEAEKQLNEAPDLVPLVTNANDYDDHERKLAARADGLLLVGWLTRDDQRRTAVSPFSGRKPSDGSAAYVIADKNWIEIGSVAGEHVRLRETADEFFGWPVFLVANPLKR